MLHVTKDVTENPCLIIQMQETTLKTLFSCVLCLSTSLFTVPDCKSVRYTI